MHIYGRTTNLEKVEFFQKWRIFPKIFLEILLDLKIILPGGSEMGRVQTSVMIDEDKRALAKQRGIKLQDLLDDALNMALELEIPGKAQLEIEKDNILHEIEIKDKQKDDYLKNYNKELERLETQKNEYLEKYQNDINDLNLKLQFNEKALANVGEEQKALEQQNERDALIQKGINALDIDNELENEMEEYCIKYSILNINDEIEDMRQEILKGITDKVSN